MKHCHPDPCPWVSQQSLPGFIPLIQDEAESYKSGDIVVLAVSAALGEGTRLLGVTKGSGEGCVWSIEDVSIGFGG